MTQQRCRAVFLGRSVTQGSVTPGFLAELVSHLQGQPRPSGDNTCDLEFSSEGLGVQMVRKDEGFESDGGDSEVSESAEDEFFPLGDVVFCHTDERVVVWVVRGRQDGLDALVFQCARSEHARALYQVFNDVSKTVKFDRYCRSRPLGGATVVLRLQNDVSAATLPRPYSRSLDRSPPTGPGPRKWNLVHRTDSAGLTYLEVHNSGEDRQRAPPQFLRNPTAQRYPHNKGPAPIPPPRKHPHNPKLILVPLKTEEAKRSLYPKEPHFVRGNLVRVSLVHAVNYHQVGFSGAAGHPRRSLRRPPTEQPRARKYLDLSSLSNKLREMVLHRRFKVPAATPERVKSVMKKCPTAAPENKKVTFNAFATVQVMR